MKEIFRTPSQKISNPTYAALNAVLILPVAFLPLAAGLFLQLWSYSTLFLFIAFFISLGAITVYRWEAR
jgi:hypothetical protein